MDAKKTAGGQDFQTLRTEITKALGGLQYGQLVIMIKDGKVVQIDRTEKRRLPSLQGINGEGI
ncbi:MAG: YezD family protein [Sporomusaceae bacterium]|nr:YezD family protein [Sporomusaceae bacterium]